MHVSRPVDYKQMDNHDPPLYVCIVLTSSTKHRTSEVYLFLSNSYSTSTFATSKIVERNPCRAHPFYSHTLRYTNFRRFGLPPNVNTKTHFSIVHYLSPLSPLFSTLTRVACAHRHACAHLLLPQSKIHAPQGPVGTTSRRVLNTFQSIQSTDFPTRPTPPQLLHTRYKGTEIQLGSHLICPSFLPSHSMRA